MQIKNVSQSDTGFFSPLNFSFYFCPCQGEEESFILKSCTRRKTDSIEKRFCFDVEAVDRLVDSSLNFTKKCLCIFTTFWVSVDPLKVLKHIHFFKLLKLNFGNFLRVPLNFNWAE